MKLFRSRKANVTEDLGKEFVDEVLEAGLAILLVVAGVSYFNLESNWADAVSLLAQKAGFSGVQSEISMMYGSVISGFPFSFIKNNFAWTVAFGVLLCLIGITIKILTMKSKEEFIKDAGKIILIPGVIGVLAIIMIQILTVNSLNDLFMSSNVSTMETVLSKTNSGMMIWNMMGLLFLIGFISLVFGAMLVYLVKALKGKPAFLYITGRFLTFIGWFSLAYYLIIRLLSIEVLAESLYGTEILKLFAFAWYMSRGTFLTAVCMFGLGFTLYRYGNRQIRIRRRMAIEHARKEQMIIHSNPYSQHIQH